MKSKTRASPVGGRKLAVLTGMPGPLALIGNPNSIFVRSMARHWHERGVKVVIVTANHWAGSDFNEDGVRVITAERGLNPEVHAALDVVVPLVTSLESELHRTRRDRVANALGSWEAGSEPPSLLPPIIDGIAIAAAVKRLQPVGVLGHEAFAYGIATALCTDVRRVLFAWGGDVLQFCNTSETAAAMMRSVLNQVTYVLAGSESVQRRVIDQFQVPASRAVQISLGVNRQQFRVPTADQALAIRRHYGIPIAAPVALNVRRLRSFWGSEVALDALLGLAATYSNLHVLFLGGAGTESAMAEARRRAATAGVGARFIGIDGDAPTEQVADLMSVSDVFVSLTQREEPLSLSVLQASACGSIGVVSDQATYRAALCEGWQGLLADPTSAIAVARQVESLLDNANARSRMRGLNERFIRDHHDEAVHMQRILRLVVGAEMAERLIPAA
ncbi:MAG: glycosyltransferase family 4 protein [Vicinamibacterales bacterium]